MQSQPRDPSTASTPEFRDAVPVGREPTPHPVARGFAQTFGLHPAVAALAVTVDLMVFGAGDVTLGVGWFASIPIGAVVAIITYMAQKKWYGDDKESALIKALVVGLLTAIPTSLPGLVSAPMGILGLFRRK